MLLQLLNSGYNVTVNKFLAKSLGIEAAYFLGELISEYNYWYVRDELQDEWFFSTTKNIEDNIGLNYYAQLKNIKILAEAGLLEYKIVGISRTRFIKLNETKISEILEKSIQEEKAKMSKKTVENFQQFSTADVEKNVDNLFKSEESGSAMHSLKFKESKIENLKNRISYNNNNINNNKNNIARAQAQKQVLRRSFQQLNETSSQKPQKSNPNFEEVCEYFRQAGLTTNAEGFFKYYSQRSWKGIHDWKHAAKFWRDYPANPIGRSFKTANYKPLNSTYTGYAKPHMADLSYGTSYNNYENVLPDVSAYY